MELEFKTEKVTARITRIFAFNSELVYLVEGEDRAVLIDTGSGFGSLRECVDKLTDKPVTVLLTHGHTDHALGSAEFDEVYISPLESLSYAIHSEMTFRRKSGQMWPEFCSLCDDQIVPAMPFEKMKPLHEGDVFDLGGISVEVFDCAGHTPGSLTMLIPEERMLLLGDACNYLVFLFDDLSLCVSDYKRSLEALLNKVRGRYDQVLLSHGYGDGVPNMIEYVIDVCDNLMRGANDKFPFVFLGTEAYLAKAVNDNGERVDGGFGNIVYSERTLR